MELISLSLSCISLTVVVVLFGRAAWTDFQRWKIENKNVMWLIGLYVPYAGISLLGTPLGQIVDLPFDLLSALLLFFVGFVFWQLKLFGAGDAKLMFPVGLYVGWNMLLAYSINLALFAVIFSLILRWPLPMVVSNTRIGIRIDEIRSSKKIPYGVVLVAALYLTLAMKIVF